MKGPSRNPQVISRRQRALAQRQSELAAWQNPKSELRQQYVEDRRQKFDDVGNIEYRIARKIEACECDIANLNAKGIN